MTTTGLSLFLIVVGAILAFAVEISVEGFDLYIAGWILMVAGLLGLLVSLIQYSSARRTVVREPVAYEEAPPRY
jgi:hypothetical protein